MADDQADIERRVLKQMLESALDPSLEHLLRPIRRVPEEPNHSYCAYCHSPTVKAIGERCEGCGSKQRITKYQPTASKSWSGPR